MQLESEGCVARGALAVRRDQAASQAGATSIVAKEQETQREEKKDLEETANMENAHGEEQRLTAPAVR